MVITEVLGAGKSAAGGVAFYSLRLIFWHLVPCSTWKSLVKPELCPSGVETGQERVSNEECWFVIIYLVPETSFLC